MAHWLWNHAKWHAELDRANFVLCRVHETMRTEELGNGFVIAKTDQFAYAMTAAHVITSGLRSAEAKTLQGRLTHLGPPETVDGDREIEFGNQSFAAIFSMEGTLSAFDIVHITLNDALDIALLKLAPIRQANLSLVLPLRLSTFTSGWGEIALAGFSFVRDTMSIQRWQDIERFRVAVTRHIASGSVVKVDGNVSALIGGNPFLADFDIPHGLSGSPIFHLLRTNNKLFPLVCGVASSDTNARGATANAGSVCSSILDVLKLPIEGNERVLDWMRSHQIETAGADLDLVKIIQDPNDSAKTIVLLPDESPPR